MFIFKHNVKHVQGLLSPHYSHKQMDADTCLYPPKQIRHHSPGHLELLGGGLIEFLLSFSSPSPFFSLPFSFPSCPSFLG